MRRYDRFILIVILCACIGWFIVPIFLAHTQGWFKKLQDADVHTLSSTVSSSLVYPVKPGQWLKFALPEDSSELRILTNATIKRPEIFNVNASWAYAVHYEILDKKGTVLSLGIYHQHSHLTSYKDAENKLIYNNFYTDKAFVPLDGRVILLGLQGIKGAAFLRVSYEALNPDIVELAVRVYAPTKVSEHQVENLWRRLSQAEKDKLATNSVYPMSLLSAAEQTNLLKHQWQAISPMGIEGQDYKTLNLYTLKDKELDDLNAVLLAPGLQADFQHLGVIPLPEHGGLVTLSFKALDGSLLTQPVDLDLQWYGTAKEQRWQQHAVWSKDTESLNYKLDGGLLVIRPSLPVIITASLTTQIKARHEIIDTLLTIKTYIASFGVDYEILHYPQRPAALRVDVRRLFTATTSPQPQQLRYEYLNAQQQIIGTGELTALNSPSLFDRVGSITEPDNVSDPVSYYFHLPEQVTRLRLVSDNPAVLVSVYNQPYGFTKWQRIPEDAYIASDKQELQLSWFPLRASNDKSLTQQLAIQWLSGQYRPPEEKPDVLAGEYLWQDFMPETAVASHFLLTDYTENEPRDDALPSVYCPLAVNRETLVKFAATPGLRSVSPELVFLRTRIEPFTAELLLNKEPQPIVSLMGKQGSMRLPETALDKQLLRLNTNSGGRWLLNYQAQCTGEKYLKRRVVALNADAPLDFVIQHSAVEEILSVHIYSPNGTVERSVLKVEIDPTVETRYFTSKPQSVWTYTKRVYDIRPLEAKAMPILYSAGQTLTNGERIAIPLNSDLAAGEYRIRLSLVKGAAGFITLSQIKAGNYEQRRFYRETEIKTP